MDYAKVSLAYKDIHCSIFPFCSMLDGEFRNETGSSIIIRSFALYFSLRWQYLHLNKMPTNWCGRENAATLKFDIKPSEATFSAVFGTSVNANWK